MRFYDVAIASLAIGAPVKWTDNILSHHDVAEVVAEKRGVARRIPHRALIRLALIRELQQETGLGAREAVRLSLSLLSNSPHAIPAGPHVSLALDLAALERTVAARLHVALESAPVPRRGRPRVRGPHQGNTT